MLSTGLIPPSGMVAGRESLPPIFRSCMLEAVEIHNMHWMGENREYVP
jgi:hypothetical protein